MDFRAAFDWISRNSLFFKLNSMGLSQKFLNLLKSLYTDTKAAVWDGDNLSEYFATNIGVKQGCLLSPLLFALIINDLHEAIGGGLLIEGVLIRLLMYADDIVLLAEDRTVLQAMINKLSEYCKIWNLVINLDKSKIMIFKKAGRRSSAEKWYLNNQEIEVVNSYKYLGVVLTPGLSFKNHLLERKTHAKTSMNVVWSKFMGKKNIKFSAKYNLFKAVSRAIFCYASQVWGFSYFNEVDKMQRYFIKRLFGFPDNSPNYMINIETGVPEMIYFGTSYELYNKSIV